MSMEKIVSIAKDHTICDTDVWSFAYQEIRRYLKKNWNSLIDYHDDITQEIIAKIIRKTKCTAAIDATMERAILSSEEIVYNRNYLRVLCVNHMARFWAKYKKTQSREVRLEDYELNAVKTEDPDFEGSVYDQYLTLMLTEIEKFSEKFRRVLLLRLQGWSHRKIAEHLNLPLGTVHSRMRYALSKLYKILMVAEKSL